MKISANLNLAEITRSDTAKRHGIDNTPTAEHLENFKLLADKVFEPIREHFKTPIFISSGYRSKDLNAFIKGSASSQHCKGQAIDIDMGGSNGEVTNRMVFDFIKNKPFYCCGMEHEYIQYSVPYSKVALPIGLT